MQVAFEVCCGMQVLLKLKDELQELKFVNWLKNE